MKKNLLLLLALTAPLAGCKKEAPGPATRAQLLSTKRWQMVSRVSTVLLPGFTPVDAYAAVPPCARDDFQRFDAPNVYVHDQGPVLCTPADPQARTGLWFLDDDGVRLTVTYAGYSVTYVIDDLTPATLKVHSVEVRGGADERQEVVFAALE